MTINRWRLIAALAAALLASTEIARPTESWSWDGTWKGALGNASSISITIEKNKVVGYSYMGAPVAVTYSETTPASLSFGDRSHYSMTLKKHGSKGVEALYHGRRGYASATLAKQ